MRAILVDWLVEADALQDASRTVWHASARLFAGSHEVQAEARNIVYGGECHRQIPVHEARFLTFQLCELGARGALHAAIRTCATKWCSESQMGRQVARKKLQLCGVTALLIASKFEAANLCG